MTTLMTRPPVGDGRPYGAIPLPALWDSRLARLDVALLPIVNAHSGRCAGYEARLRGVQGVGFDTTPGFFNAAHADGVLAEVEAAVWSLGLLRFQAVMASGSTTAPEMAGLKLFLNIDGRSLHHGQRLAGLLSYLLRAVGLSQGTVVLELSEHQGGLVTDTIASGLDPLRAAAGKVAIDHFGVGTGGLPLLHAVQPQYVKIDGFFLGGAAQDARKKMLLRHMVNLAHLLGAEVMVEGVAEDRDFHICKEVGCDLVQGPLIDSPGMADIPTPDIAGAAVRALLAVDRRHGDTDVGLVRDNITRLAPVTVNDPLSRVFDSFHADQSLTFVPVVTADGEPAGIVRETDIKAYAYSPFGRDLLSNKACGRRLRDFVWRCPVADVNTTAERILEIFSADDNSDGILIVDQGRYVGFLSSRALLRILNEKNLALARDQNPLTKLPGNAMINAYLAEVLADGDASVIIVYLDFDNFKPFNDGYGFRQGDRAITLFADILRREVIDGPDGSRCFIAHVGGDDFFAGFRDLPFETVEATVQTIVERFRAEVEGFYDEATRQAGHVMATMRDGSQARIPLLSASAALVEVPSGHAPGDLDDLSSVIAATKKEAKKSPTKMASITALAPLK